MSQATEHPFQFVECMELKQILGIRAGDEKQLADLLQEAPLDTIFYHTYGVHLRNVSITGVYPNDFASWVAIQVRDQALAERLAVLDPFDYAGLEELRNEIVSVIDDHLAHLHFIPRVLYGEPFEFIQSRIVEVPTPYSASNLWEFCNYLSEVDVSAVYFHFIEARVRLGRGRSDFSRWIGEGLGLDHLAALIDAINPYSVSLERLRSTILTVCDEALKMEGARIDAD